MYHTAEIRDHLHHWQESMHVSWTNTLKYMSQSNFWMVVIILAALVLVTGLVLALSYYIGPTEGASQVPSPYLYGPFM